MSRNQNKRERTKTARTFENKFEEERSSMIVNILPKNDNQAYFLKALANNKIIVANGSAGTGKTFIAATHAANQYLKNSQLEIYMSRPYVPMGRTVGMMPGNDIEKMGYFLAPIINVLKKQLGKKYDADFGKNIHVQLLEAIRGMDLQNAILLVDEAQNLTIQEIKSIVTRIGDGAQIILTGDSYQSDLPKGESGLEWLCDMIDKYDIRGADFVEFTSDDIVRSGLVKQFIQIFDKEGV